MAQYIELNALVAEIDKRLDELWDLLPNASDVIKDNYTKEEANITGKYTALESFKNFINAFEVKEVDLDSNIRVYLTNHFNVYEDGVLQSKESSQPLSTYDIIKVAKHFFELGLKIQKGE